MNQMPVPSVESLSVDEFLMRFDDADIYKQTQAIQMFEFANAALKDFCRTENPAEGPPQIRIRSAQGLQAEGNSWAIYINEDLFDYYLNLTEPPVLEVIPVIKETQRHFHDPFFFVNMAFMWLILHELFHSHRTHNEVAKSVGVSRETLFAIEMDSDSLATAAVYRQAQHRYQSYHADLIVKQITFTFLYWAFRGLPEPKTDDSHPSSINRLGMMMQKLILLRRLPTDPADPSCETQESWSAVEPLLNCFINCERAFSAIKGIEPDFNSIGEFCSGTTRSIVVRWDEIRGHVSRLSGTQA